MAVIDNNEKQLFIYFIHWSPSGPAFLLHLGKKWINGGHQSSKDHNAFRFWTKITKIQDGPQRPFEQNRFLSVKSIIKCNKTFLTNFGMYNPSLFINLQL